ncbi:hypothetical protein, partial [Chamaesiphon sp. OTE_20_metabat_361]|uniref:hypothetical protein n=1 Tax=Chamaesiphon sp. OTE_20_metabat_361 TaxID=2964689 RepID=UPI00286BDB29
DRQQQSTGRLHTITDACAAMKDEIASEAQQMICGAEKTGKPPTFTEACSTMKEQMADEAQHIVGVPSSTVVGADEAKSLERDLPHSQQIEQAKMALKEASWFEQ